SIRFAELRGAVARLLQAEVGGFFEPLWAEERQIDRCAEGEEALVGADVARGFFAADVLFAALERENEAAFAAAVNGFAGDAAGHAADKAFAAGHDPEVRAPVLHGGPERMAFGDGDVGTPISGAF